MFRQSQTHVRKSGKSESRREPVVAETMNAGDKLQLAYELAFFPHMRVKKSPLNLCCIGGMGTL